jgi:hypothetical protein
VPDVVLLLLVQLGVAGYLYAGLGQTTYAAVLLGLILPQVNPSEGPFV